jgi:hypothetical protein
MNAPTVQIRSRELREPTLRTIACVQGSDAEGEGLQAHFEKCPGSRTKVRSS